MSWDADGRLKTAPPTPGARTEPGLVIYRFGVGIFYANAERLADDVEELTDGPQPPRWFVLHADAIDDVDFTAGKTLLEITTQLPQLGIVFAVAEADPGCASARPLRHHRGDRP